MKKIIIIIGENDYHTTLEESRQLFETANQPKTLWIIPQVEHTDFYKTVPKEYEQQVLDFFAKNLRGE